MIFLIFFSIIGVVDTIKYLLTKVFKISKSEIKRRNNARSIIKSTAYKDVLDNEYIQLIRVDNFDNNTSKIVDITKVNSKF